MIDCLYEPFKKWASKGSIYLISDPHFNDPDCKLIDKHWPTPTEYVEKIKSVVHKNDTLICLGDVGQPAWFKEIKAYKVLIKGNHDGGASKYEPYFDEIYEGPLMISEKILLSHEPIICLPYVLNIHGHNHAGPGGIYYDDIGAKHLNICANTISYEIINLGKIIKEGILSGIEDIHRVAINRAIERKK